MLLGFTRHWRWLMPRWVSSASVAQAPKPIDKRADQHSEAQNCSGTLQIMGNRLDVGSMLAKIKPCQCPCRNPKRAAERIEDEKAAPIHFQHPRHDAVQLTQDIDEPCEGDGYGTISREDRFDAAEAIGGDADLLPVAEDYGAAKPPSNQIPYIVSEHGTGPRRQHQRQER